VALGYRAWGAVAFLVLYNAAHVACRVWALRAGWDHGMAVAAALNAPWVRVANRLAAPVAGLCVGVMLPVAFGWQLTGAPTQVVGLGAVGAVVVTLVLRLGGARYGAAGIATVVLGATWLLGFVWR
jgi:mannose/fructose/N-acetylgalactosamine-specific phosphotransferase system component IID